MVKLKEIKLPKSLCFDIWQAKLWIIRHRVEWVRIIDNGNFFTVVTTGAIK